MRMKRFLAGFLCLCMVGTMDMPYVQAAAVAAKSEPVAQESVKQDAEDAKPSEDVENQGNDQRSEAAKQKEVVKDTQAAEQAESAGSTENKTEQTALLNYALIDQPTVEMPGTQNVLLSIGDENTVIESAVLDYVNETTGKTYQAQASTISQDAMLFTMEFPEGSEAGAYRLVGVTYQINGTEQSLLFQDAGMDMRFGVNTTVETNPDSVVVDEPSADVDVVTMDENGNTESADSIGDAIRNAQAETPATNSMDDVAAMGAAKNIVVVLDPGHDDTHAGARRNGLEEEDLTLKIAQYCKAELSQYNGVTVYMTRESGACANGGGAVTSTECNAKRVEYAQSVGANVYVSMHINAGGGNGAEIFYPNQNYRSDLGTTGHDLAQQILNKILELGIGEHGQGLKIHNSEDNTLYPDGSLADYLGVIRRSKLAGIPAILIEHAYIDTSDANYLNSDEKLKKFGVADATGIANYYGLTKGMQTPRIKYVKSVGTGNLKITWNAVNGATQYEIYQSNSKNKGYKRIATVAGTSYKQTSVRTGKFYYYKIRAIAENGQKSAYSGIISGQTLTKVKVKQVKSVEKGLEVSWTPVSGAVKYAINRKGDGKGYKIIATVNNTSQYKDKSAKEGVKYTYKIRAIASDGGYGTFGNAVSGKRLGTVGLQSVKKVSEHKVLVQWSKVENAERYQIFRSTSQNGKYTKIGTTSSTQYHDKSKKKVATYYYKVRAVRTLSKNTLEYGTFSLPKSILAGKMKIQYVCTYRSTKMQIGWDKVEGASYQLYRSTSKNGTYSKIATTKKTRYINTKCKTGKTYYYKVRPIIKSGNKTIYYGFSDVKSGSTLEAPKIVELRSTNSNTLEIKWKNVKGSKSYQVYRAEQKEGTYKKIAEVAGTAYKDTSCKQQKNYYYKVRAMKKVSGVNGYSSNSKIKSGKTLKQVILEYAAAGTSNKISLSWKRISGATGYQIYRSTTKDGTYKKIASIKKNSYNDRSVKVGQTYFYRVRATKRVNNVMSYGSMSGRMETATLKRAEVTSANKTSENGASISWKSIKGADHYVVLRSTNKEGQYSKIKITSARNYVDNSTTGGTTYYYKVRGVKVINGRNNYGTCSEPASVTTGYTIMGGTTVTKAQMVSYYNSSGKTYPAGEYGIKGAGSIEKFCDLVILEANKEGVRAEVVFAQICLETGFLQFGGQVSVGQCNFGGLGATDNGAAGATFPNVQTGLRAQVQHLKAYASTQPLNQTCVDPRFSLVVRGCAPYVEWLGQKENPTGRGWATAEGYGNRLVKIISLMKAR